MRVLFTLLLCFLVVIQGGMSAHAFQAPCPMGHAPGMPTSADVAMDPDSGCCNDAETAAKTGKLCKTDASCSHASVCIPSSINANIHAARAASPVFTVYERIDEIDPPDVWRPPSSSQFM